MNAFLWGAIAMASVAIAGFFLRFWRERRDPLFGWFGLAFLVLAADWVALAALRVDYPGRAYLYVVRLAAFVLILLAIVQKNRGDR